MASLGAHFEGTYNVLRCDCLFGLLITYLVGLGRYKVYKLWMMIRVR